MGRAGGGGGPPAGRGACAGDAAGATPSMVALSGDGAFGSAGGGTNESLVTPSTAPSTEVGAGRDASLGESTLNDAPHFGQRIFNPLCGMRRSST
ncbi:MAG: hypothetical protein QM756_30925 [Polyangiaceae bacterium]